MNIKGTNKKHIIDYITYLIVILLSISVVFFISLFIRCEEHFSDTTKIILVSPVIVLLLVSAFIIKKITRFKDELLYNKLATDRAEELILFLDKFGVIKHCNCSFTNNLNITKKEIINRPLREIFYMIKLLDTDNFKKLILEKLKIVFSGHETEIISPVKITNSGDLRSLHLKMMPIYNDTEITNIICIGRILATDYITNEWLQSENCEYELSNNFAALNKFCYRLTRNLEKRMSHEQIVHLQIALHEIIINAIEHGNLEIDFKHKTELKKKGGSYLDVLLTESNNEHLKNRKVHIYYSLEKDRVTYIIEDDGKGFNWKRYLNKAGQIEQKSFIQTMHGLGLHIVKETFDIIEYNKTGNKVTLVKLFNSNTE